MSLTSYKLSQKQGVPTLQRSKQTAAIWSIMLALALAVPCAQAADSSKAISQENCKLAANYSAGLKGASLLVMQDGKIIFEDYPNGCTAEQIHELASGTKSFSGIVALAAQRDGILSLDEKVADTITEWKDDADRNAITIRHLLTLTSGMKTTIGRAPTYAACLKSPVVPPPGEVFQYGAEPFQVFGEVMRRKLSKSHETMVDYLHRRVLDPAGIKVGNWRSGADGMPLIPQGAQLTAREWAKFGELVRQDGKINGKQVLAPGTLEVCFEGTKANPMYGLTWWLNRPIDEKLRASITPLTVASDLRYGSPGVPNDLVMAAGAGKQRLYVVPSLNLVVVRQATGILDSFLERAARRKQREQGKIKTFSDNEFIQLLTRGKAST